VFNPFIKLRNRTGWWLVLTLSAVLVALYFGLQPRGWNPVNGARWLPGKGTIRFDGRGLAYVNDLKAVRSIKQPFAWTLEMPVTPDASPHRGFNALMVMHAGLDRRQFGIWQWGTSLIAMNGDDYNNGRRWPRVVAERVFASPQTRYLTITSGRQGTYLYIDGRLTAHGKWRLYLPTSGRPLRMVLGNSVHGRNGWEGKIHGLAISAAALPAQAVKEHYERWRLRHDLDFLKQNSPLVLFDFDRLGADGFPDLAGHPQRLEVPKYMIILEKTFLSIPQGYATWRQAALADMLLNTVGFIPLGAVWYGFLACFSGFWDQYKQSVAVVVCMLLSLAIELGQAWIPTRVSSLTDLILNTFGAWVGVVLMRLIVTRITQFPIPS
jgi:VanZ family protein